MRNESYTAARLPEQMIFFQGDICCKKCELWRSEHGVRFRCMITMEIITDMDGRGMRCPLEKIEEAEKG